MGRILKNRVTTNVSLGGDIRFPWVDRFLRCKTIH